MVGEEVPEKMETANAARYHEYWKMVKIERKLQKRYWKILNQGQPSQNRFYTQHYQEDTQWSGVERATPVNPKTVEAAEAVWKRGQSSQGCKTKGQKHQEYVSRSRDDV